jgi:hypothetical protein
MNKEKLVNTLVMYPYGSTEYYMGENKLKEAAACFSLQLPEVALESPP